MARVASNEDPDSLMRYAHARADSADRQAEIEATDPVEIRARQSEFRLLRWLIAMVLAIVLGGFVVYTPYRNAWMARSAAVVIT